MLDRFELTTKGEPLCITEYATKMARHKHVHVLQFEDLLENYEWDELRHTHITPHADFEECNLH